jgi:hypothetical protein
MPLSPGCNPRAVHRQVITSSDHVKLNCGDKSRGVWMSGQGSSLRDTHCRRTDLESTNKKYIGIRSVLALPAAYSWSSVKAPSAHRATGQPWMIDWTVCPIAWGPLWSAFPVTFAVEPERRQHAEP